LALFPSKIKTRGLPENSLNIAAKALSSKSSEGEMIIDGIFAKTASISSMSSWEISLILKSPFCEFVNCHLF
jgi:hypothetical protein